MASPLKELTAILSSLQQNNEPEALRGLSQLQVQSPDTISAIQGRLWKVCGSPLPGHPKAHDNFGYVSLFNKEPRCASSTLEKSLAVANVIIDLQAKKNDELSAEVKSLKEKGVSTQTSTPSTVVKAQTQIIPSTTAPRINNPIAPVQPASAVTTSLPKLPKIDVAFDCMHTASNEKYKEIKQKVTELLKNYFTVVKTSEGNSDGDVSLHIYELFAGNRSEWDVPWRYVNERSKGRNVAFIMPFTSDTGFSKPAFEIVEGMKSIMSSKADGSRLGFYQQFDVKKGDDKKYFSPGINTQKDFCSDPAFVKFVEEKIYGFMKTKIAGSSQK